MDNSKAQLFSILILVAFILFSGCLQPQKSDKELFLELNDKAKDIPNGKYVYEIAYSTSQALQGLQVPIGGSNNLQFSVGLYKLNKKTKVTVSMSLMGVTQNIALFERDGKFIACTESSSAMIGSGSSLNCEEISKDADSLIQIKAAKPRLYMDLSKFKKYSVKFLGEKSYINRPCYNFSLDVNGNDLLENPFGILSGMMGADNSISALEMLSRAKLHYDFCMDKEYGFVLNNNLKVIKYSEILEKESKLLEMDTAIKEFSTTVSESDFEIPIDFQLENTNCDSNSVSFELLVFNDLGAGQLKVNVTSSYNEFEKQTKYVEIPSIIAGQTQKIDATSFSNLSDSVEIEVCKGEKCSNGMCYVEPAQVTSVEFNCTDSDGGKDYKIKGAVTTVNFTGSAFEDTCVDDELYDNVLLEYFCSDNNIDVESERVRCDSGCSEGACK